MNDKPPVYLIDGSHMIFRAYHSLPSMSTGSGEVTGAVFGFTRMLLALIRNESPDRLAVVFDTARESFRNELYPNYKANRPPPPEDLVPQFERIRQVVDALAVRRIELEGYEADDIIATLATQARAQGRPVVIVTGDKDLMQLVDDEHGIVLWDQMKDVRYDRAAVLEKWGVPPEKIGDLLALAGDSSDNIPGVPGIGPKTAAKLIEELGDLPSILEGAEKMKKSKRKDNLIAHRADAELSRELVELARDLELPLGLDDLTRGEPDAETAHRLFEELEFRTLRDEFLGRLQAQEREGDGDDASPRAEYRMIVDKAVFDALIEDLRHAKRIAFDFETTGLDAITCEIVGVSFSTEPHRAAYIPIRHRALEAQLDERTVLAALKELCEDERKIKIAQNAKYEWTILMRRGIEPAGPLLDTMLLSYVVDPLERHNMDDLAAKYLQHKTIHFEDVAGKGAKQLGFDEVDPEAATEYAAEDADVTLRLAAALEPLVREREVWELYESIEAPLVPVLTRMELAGVQVDADYLAELSTEFGAKADALQGDIHRIAGEEFNIASPKQLGEILFDKLGLPTKRKTKTKSGWSTSHDILEELAREYDICALVLAWRSLTKLKGTYTDALPKRINAETGRIHTSYHQAVAATGRLSSNDPNLQNIPIRTEDGRRIRKAFVAPPGRVLLSADYSQVELRIAAHLSEEQRLIKAFADGADIHRRTAAQVHGVMEDLVTDEMRRDAKAVNFGILYGMSAYGLSQSFEIPQREAKAIIERYFSSFPQLAEFIERLKESAREKGYAETMFGRRVALPDIKGKNPNLRAMAERNAINYPIQGTAAEIIKKAMIELDARIRTERLPMTMLMQVHDELVLEVDRGEEQAMSEVVREAMVGAAELRAPLVVDIGFGADWGEAH